MNFYHSFASLQLLYGQKVNVDSTERIFTGGLPSLTAAAWECLKKWGGASKPRLLLCPDLATMENLREELQNLSPSLEFFILPALESDLVKNRGPSLPARMQRIRFFSQFFLPELQSSSRHFLVCPEALLGQMPPPSYWQQNSRQIKVGQSLSRTELQADLVRLAYMPAELVERAGEYAIRGSIVDIFSPVYDHPVRLELFGDEVQSLKHFHPDNQRSLESREDFWIPPAREFLFPEDGDRLKSVLRKKIDSLDWERKDRDAFLSRIEQRAFFPTIDLWGPLIDPSTLSQGDKALNALEITDVFEAALCDREASVNYKRVQRNFLAAASESEWVPAPEDFLFPEASIQAYIQKSLGDSHWWDFKAQSLHPLEPEKKKLSGIRSLDRLSEELHNARVGHQELPLQPLSRFAQEMHAAGHSLVIVGSSTSQLERLLFLLRDYHLAFKIFPSLDDILSSATPAPLAAVVADLDQGFWDQEGKIALLLDEQILGTLRKKSRRSPQSRSGTQAFSPDLALLDLRPQDLIVHTEHGIGKYLGLKSLQVQGIFTELVEIEYREGNKLLLPVTKLGQIQKYSAAGGELSQLDRLGGQSWETKKSRVKAALQSIAGELLHLYSERELARGPQICPDPSSVEAFALSFPYSETADQESAIAAGLLDLRGPKPMDRLLCGDVGYGKTEVALRLAHAAMSAKFQAAVLVPTTLLATQHESTFRKRLEPFGFKVAGLSRFKSQKESKDILKSVAAGEIDVLIGTHRLLGNDVNFKNLGLLVVDEEQKFGVSHKEKLKRFKNNVHILSMTATPIPRTLNMAMSGIKDLSIITTPPQDRLSVRTHVAKWKDALIVEAVENEVKRGGQIFFVHNRVQTIGKLLESLKTLLPQVSMEFVHGQMEEEKLSERMINFYEGRTQLLLTTSIIESGLDVANANTLIVDRADRFGLAQLYQMRGRVGRSSSRAYAYFLLPKDHDVSQDAEERLAVLESYQELGSGFHIASHDLEIRGSGEFLGREQSGHMAAIGFDAYTELLRECVAEIKGEAVETKIDPEIQLGTDTHIPDSYIPEVGLRLMFYRKLAASADEHEVDSIERELQDRFGQLPPTVQNLVLSMRIRCQLRRLGIKSLTAGKTGFSVFFASSTPVNPAKLVESIKKYPAHFQMSPEGRLFLRRPEGATDSESLLKGVEGALGQLEAWCG